MKKLKVGILGCMSMAGQRLISLLFDHPWFEIACVADSPVHAGKLYLNAIENKWKLDTEIPDDVQYFHVYSLTADIQKIVSDADFVICALDISEETVRKLEFAYAEAGIPVVTYNPANRMAEYVPIVIPEVNPSHLTLIDIQRKKFGWKNGFIASKANCSIQSYVAVLTALAEFEPVYVSVVNLEALSGAGQIYETWPDMVDNIIPYIQGEEEKEENEPLKIWGKIENGKLRFAQSPRICSTSVRVRVSDGHMACVHISFKQKPTREQIITAVRNYKNPIAKLKLPSAPKHYIKFCEDADRPQVWLDRDCENGMSISMGRLREDSFFDWKFISMSNNSIRGDAGGIVLLAELLVKKGYL